MKIVEPSVCMQIRECRGFHRTYLNLTLLWNKIMQFTYKSNTKIRTTRLLAEDFEKLCTVTNYLNLTA